MRDFNLPTLLLSATPYRNDYKSFRVRGRFVFNYSFGEAVADKTIRAVQFKSDARAGVTKSRDSSHRFVASLKAMVPAILSAARHSPPILRSSSAPTNSTSSPSCKTCCRMHLVSVRC